MKRILLQIALFFLGILIFVLFFLVESDVPLSDLKAKYTYEDSAFIEVNQLQIHYRKSGTGFPILLIHGTGSSLHTWNGWTQILKDSFEVISLDLPGFGLTGPFPEGDYSLASYTSIIDQFTTTLGLDSFHICGNSLGGNIAWKYFVEHPQRIGKLILVDADGYPDSSSQPSVIKMAKNPVLGPLLKHITPKKIVASNLKDVFYDDKLVTEQLINRYHELARRPGNRQAFIDRCKTPFRDEHTSVNLINCPTLILWGMQDTWISPTFANRFHNDILGSKLILYDNVGHIPMEEIPLQSGKDALEFLLAGNQ